MARFNVEVEFRSMAQGIRDLMRLRILKELRVNVKMSMRLYCDNMVVISIAYNFVHHYHTKHVEVDRHFIQGPISKYFY